MLVKLVFYFCSLLCICNLSARTHSDIQQKPRRMLIMLDPAGDAQHAGRKIDDNFERGITLQFVQELKKVLEQKYPNVRIMLTRGAGDMVAPLQHANFANRMNVDLYLSFHFYHNTSAKPKIYVYTFSSGVTFPTITYDLCFYPCDQAYIFNKETTQKYATIINNELSQEPTCDVKKVELPFKPLIGIKSPAIAIESSLKDGHTWKQYVEPIAKSLRDIIDNFHN